MHMPSELVIPPPRRAILRYRVTEGGRMPRIFCAALPGRPAALQLSTAQPRSASLYTEGGSRSRMALPPNYDLRAAALRLIGDGRVHQIREVIDDIAAELDVSGADRNLPTPKMCRNKFDIAVESAVSDLRKAAWLENVELGRFHITNEGRAALSQSPKKIDLEFLRANSAQFRERVPRGRRRGPGGEKGASGADGAEHNGIVAAIVAHVAGGSGSSGGAKAAHDGPLRLLRRARDLLKGEEALGRPTTAAFSGTLFMAAEGGTRRNLLLAFGRAVWPVIVHAIREDVLVSGCVACGRFSRPADNWVTGPAADEAVAQHGMPRWVGISAAPSADGVLARAVPRAVRAGRGPYARHGMPLGAPLERGVWAVNWPGLCGEEDGCEVEELLGIIDDRIETTPDAGATARWRITRQFCELALSAP